MSFAIVEFTETEEVEVVPAKWVDDDVCRWPGGKVERGRKLARRLAEPTEDWPKYPAKLKGLFSTYAIARTRLPRYEVTSDEETDDENKKRPVVRPKRFLSTDDEEIPRKRIPKRLAQGTENYPRVPQNFPLATASCNTIEPNEAEEEIMPGTSHLNLNPHSDRDVNLCDPSTKNLGRAAQPRLPEAIPEAEFQKQVLRQLQLMRLMIEQLSERIERAQPVQKSCGHEGKPALVKEAFTSLQDFEEFDEGASKVKEQLLHEFQALGGVDVSGATKRILLYLMQDRVAQNYSWVGNKGKRKFCNLAVTPIIIDAVRSNKLFTATVNEVEGVIKKWLQHASCRLKLKQAV